MKKVLHLNSIQCAYLSIFLVYFVCLIGGWTLTHTTVFDEVEQEVAAIMLLGALLISYTIATVVCARFVFKLTYKKSVLFTILLSLFGLLVYTFGGYLFKG